MSGRPHPAHVRAEVEPGIESAAVYAVEVMEPDASNSRSVPIPQVEFQRAVQRLAHDARMGSKTLRQAAQALLNLAPTMPEARAMAVTGFFSDSESNLARHGRRMAGEFFWMLTF